MYGDLPLDQLRRYSPAITTPDDFDRFWEATISSSLDRVEPTILSPVETPLTSIDVFDVTFSGFGGQAIKGWLRIPSTASTPLPTVVEFVGYGGGRGHATEELTLAASGYAHFQMDTRGQGSSWSVGATPDLSGPSGPQIPGMMTRGIESREDYYYRRLMLDAILAVRAAAALDLVDETRIGVSGVSQGGALALTAAAFNPDIVRAASIRVPFLADFARAIMITDAYPFREIVDYLRIHRARAEDVLATLAYFDSVSMARRATAPARFSVGLMDVITPPSTVYAAFNAYAGEKTIAEWAYNGHEGGGHDDLIGEIEFFRDRL